MIKLIVSQTELFPDKSPYRFNWAKFLLFSLLATIIIFYLQIFSATSEPKNTGSIAQETSTSEITTSPEKVLENLDPDGSINIIYTDNTLLNCGALASLEKYPSSPPTGGCFREETPNTIYLTTNIPQSNNETIEYLTTHEYAHYLQYKNGEPLNECQADKFAEANGVLSSESFYSNQCSTH